MSSMIHSSLVIRAMEANGIPLGGALIVHEGGEKDGTMGFNAQASDLNAVMSQLTGAVLELHAIKTMVGPSNAGRLKEARDTLKTLAINPRAYKDWDNDSLRDMFESLREDIEAVIDNISFKEN